ncbi:TlpA family protein disulfide reductase [Roseovarius sp. 2305UL8-3]|uniref:TlpA family protein disulfide reductase n=1 Tax=Roseovarius conchicola TaxID=3121636 RepID=UPI003528B689
MKLRWLVLYLALGLSANTAAADMADLEALRVGDMKKLVFHETAKPVSEIAFEAADGGEGTLADYRGKYMLLNFWATWCAPCRKEMPMLSDLQTELGGDTFEVVTLATGRNARPAMAKFFEEIGVDNLPLHRDPKSQVARAMGVFGLPITVIVDPEGNEIARLQGDADWSSDSAKAILQTLVAPES